MATNDRFLGVPPRATARTIAEATQLRAVVSKESRASLTQAEKIKLQGNAEKGLEIKYDLLDSVNLSDVDTLKAVYNMAIRTEELKEDMARYDMDGVFLIPNDFKYDATEDEYHPVQGAAPINLFDSAAEVEFGLVKLASQWMMRFRADFHIENLFWSGSKILNSCTPRLREKLEESTQGLSTQYKTGPVFFVMLYKLVLSSTPVSMRAVIRRLEDLKLSAFQGENVKSAVSLIKGAVGLLENNGAVPSDMIDIAFRIMKSSSSLEFNTHVNAMRTNHDLKVKTMELDDLLLNLQTKYNELTLNGEWDVGTNDDNQNSIFTSYECHSCGGTDHFWRQCPSQNMDRVALRLRELGVQPRGRGGRGRGRGGRGSAAPRNVFRIPPGRGQPHVRRRGPLVERWCGTCGVWGSHASEQHSNAESAQCAVSDDQSHASALTQPTTATTVVPSTTPVESSTSTNSQQEPVRKTVDDDSVPTLFLDFV